MPLRTGQHAVHILDLQLILDPYLWKTGSRLSPKKYRVSAIDWSKYMRGEASELVIQLFFSLSLHAHFDLHVNMLIHPAQSGEKCRHYHYKHVSCSEVLNIVCTLLLEGPAVQEIGIPK